MPTLAHSASSAPRVQMLEKFTPATFEELDPLHRHRVTLMPMGEPLTCTHGLPLGDCTSPSCPRWLGDPQDRLPWKTGWAMSEYSGTSPHDTYMGDLVHRAKYGDAPRSEREEAAEEIALRMMSFIDYTYGRDSPPFSACITAPSHNPKTMDLAARLCTLIANAFALRDWTDLLRNSSPTESVKTLRSGVDRYRVLENSITVTPIGDDRAVGGLLFVDDVFETGATARAVCEAIRAHYPQQEFHVLTATRRPANTWGSR